MRTPDELSEGKRSRKDHRVVSDVAAIHFGTVTGLVSAYRPMFAWQVIEGSDTLARRWQLNASDLTVSKPESRQREGNMISSAEGFRILDNWKMQRTPLWLAVPSLDQLEGPVVRIVEVSTEPAEVVFDLGDNGKFEPLDLNEAVFDMADSDEAPYPVSVRRRFGFFLNLWLPDGREFILAQQVQ